MDLRLIFLSGLVLASCSHSANKKPLYAKNNCPVERQMKGKLSGKEFCLPEVNASMPAIAPSGVVKNGLPVKDFHIKSHPGQPDQRSYKRKFGVLIPATNTSVEHEIWSIIFQNQGKGGLDGVGVHTVNVKTPKASLNNEAELLVYKKQFIDGLGEAIKEAELARPQYLIMGMSLEHILHGIGEIRAVMTDVEKKTEVPWATWHDAADAALKKYKAKRIGLLTPFDKKGNENAIKMFEDLGYEVVSSFGFACADAHHIAHIPDSDKERAILEHLATEENKLDAILQLGTNMSMIKVSEKLEGKIGIPILGINAVTFWYALRENGFEKPLINSGRLLREF